MAQMGWRASLSDLRRQVIHDTAKSIAHGQVTRFFSENLGITFEMMRESELWRSTILGQEPVTDADLDRTIQTLLRILTTHPTQVSEV